MSDDNNSNRVQAATLVLPNGKSVDVLLKPKTFSSGNTGWYATIPRFAYGDHIFGGGMNIYRMDRTEAEKSAKSE